MGLYHYCSLEKGLSILKNQNIRLSDISKSNDFRELELFFPQLHETILTQYEQNPFPFAFFEETNFDAMRALVLESRQRWMIRFNKGDFANFVLCFSEKSDCLSQWRGYANDAKGLCIGFSRKDIEDYCASTKGVLTLVKVNYVSDKKLEKIISDMAGMILEELKTLRTWIVDNMTHNDHHDDTDRLLSFNFDGMIENAFTQSLGYKSKYFEEEKEWRIFFASQAYKTSEWIYSASEEPLRGPNLFPETIDFLKNRIDFHWTEDDLIPYCPLQFNEFQISPVKEVWIGPKSNVRRIDMELFLNKHGYKQVEIHYSAITYR